MGRFYCSILFFICLLASGKSFAQTPQLSPDAEISLLTCTPGPDLYSVFGHSAIRVRDVENGIDVVFNYGTFSFGPDFYREFAMGNLNYYLSVSSYENFEYSYVMEGRGIAQQTLDLTPEQEQSVFEFLDWNRQKENRYYLYDYFYNNCSSKIRDVMEQVLGQENIQWPNLKEPEGPSIRQLTDRYLGPQPWGDLGIDIGLGAPCDVVPTSRQYMFLPDYLMMGFDGATLNGKPLVRATTVLLRGEMPEIKHSIFNPVPLFWILLALIAVASFFAFRKGKKLKGLDAFLLFVAGLIGIFVTFLWTATLHQASEENFTLMWAWPFMWLVIPFTFFNSRFTRIFFLAYAAVLAIMLLGFPFWPHQMHAAIVPLGLMLLLRSVVRWKMASP